MKSMKLIALSLAFVLGAVSLCAEDKIPELKKKDVVVCFGDSVTMVGGANPYSAILGKMVDKGFRGKKIKVERVHFNGAPMSKLAANFDEAVLKKHPKATWVLVQDAGAAEPIEKFEKALQEIIDKCVKKDIKVVLLTTGAIEPGFQKYKFNPKKIPFEKHNELRRKLAKEKGVYLIDLEEKWNELMKAAKKADMTLTYDGCHPDETGLVAIAAVIAEALGVPKKAVSFRNSVKFKKLTKKQFETIVETVYE